MVIGFVGFGEANSSIAQGLREEGLSEIICFDAMQADPRFRDKIAQTHLIRVLDNGHNQTILQRNRQPP